MTTAVPHAPTTLLVLADDPSRTPRSLLRDRARGYERALVVAPATPDARARWIVDDDLAAHLAADRAAAVAADLRAAGLDARTEVGDPDPGQALADALAQHPVDGILVLSARRARPGRPRRSLLPSA